MESFSIITYGGVEILGKIFIAISMLLQKGGTFFHLSVLSASIGALIVIVKALFAPNLSFLKTYFFPLLILIVLSFNVTTSVIIEDRLALDGVAPRANVDKILTPAKKIDKVPLIVGFISQIISTIGYKITDAVETVMVMPDDQRYSKVGMIFGSDSALQMGEIRIKDGLIDSNLRSFCRNCVFYDLGLNFYTVEELKNSGNLLDFLKSRTSSVRMTNYKTAASGKYGNEAITCKEAVTRLASLLGDKSYEIKHQAKKEIFQRLPLAYNALTTINHDANDLIRQSLVMSVLMDENASQAFAAKRAAMQQKSTYQSIGAMAGNSLVWMRIIFEALIYASVIFIIPLAFLPSGFKYLLNWMFLAAWIQLWPPFYSILQYILQIAASSYASAYVDPNTAGCQLTIYSSVGLSEIYSNVSALAGYMSLSIPYLSYALIKGGVGSLIHLTGSLMSPIHSAGATAASEQTTGNYSFGNTSMDSEAFANASGFQQNFSPSLSHGMITEQTANRDVTWGGGSFINRDKFSQNARSLSGDHTLSSSLQNSLQTAQTAHDSVSASHNESVSEVQRASEAYQQHASIDNGYSFGESTKEAFDFSESVSWLTNAIDSFAHNHGYSRSEAWNIALSLKAPGAGLGINLSEVSEEAWQEAKTLSESQDFREHYQRAQDFVENYSHNENFVEGERATLDYVASLDKMRTTSEQLSASFDQLNQVSKTASFVDGLSFGDKMSLDQRFNDYLVEKTGSAHSALEVLDHPDSSEMEGYISDFMSERASEYIDTEINPDGFIDPGQYYQQSYSEIPQSSETIDSTNIPKTMNDIVPVSTRQKVEERIEEGKRFRDIANESITFEEGTLNENREPFAEEVHENANYSRLSAIGGNIRSYATKYGLYCRHYDDSGCLYEYEDFD